MTNQQHHYQRLMLLEHISQEKKQELTFIYKAINPFELKKQIQRKLDLIFGLVERNSYKNVLQTKYDTAGDSDDRELIKPKRPHYRTLNPARIFMLKKSLFSNIYL